MPKNTKEKIPKQMEEKLYALGEVPIWRIISKEELEDLSIEEFSKILFDILKRYHFEILLTSYFKDYKSEKLAKLKASIKKAKINDKANCRNIFKELENRFAIDN